jgi:hypothetical protein
MRESEKLAAEGLRTLVAAGWPEDKAQELMDVFMRAGMHYWCEIMEDDRLRNEALIQKAVN